MLTTISNYRLFSSNLERTLNSTAKQPQVARETEYYLANIEKVKSIDDFLGNDRLYRYAMKAWGLEDMTYAKAFMRKVLTEGVSSSQSFANKLSDTRYRQFATAFDFAANGETATTLDAAKQGTVDRYVRQKLEQDAGSQNEGVRLALYFERSASNITSAYSILGDKALLKVVQTSLGLPTTMSLLDIDRQAEMITDRLDLADLKDTKKLQSFLTSFAAKWDIDNQSTSQTSPVALLIQPTETGVSSNLLTSLQNLKLGGM